MQDGILERMELSDALGMAGLPVATRKVVITAGKEIVEGGTEVIGPIYQKLKNMVKGKGPETSIANKNADSIDGELDFYSRVDNAGFTANINSIGQPKELVLDNGVVISSNPNKTTTVLGKYNYDGSGTGDALSKANYPETGTYDFGEKVGGFNLLDIPSRAANPIYEQGQFWSAYNKPFLDEAISRGDDIALTTIPNPSNINDFVTSSGEPIGMFGRELKYLSEKNYKPENIDENTWLFIKKQFTKYE